jgi:hypothetical protein
MVNIVANRPRFGCYSQLPTGAYWGLLMPTVISVSIWLPVSSVLSACYCLDRHCALKSLVTSGYARRTRQLLPTILCIYIPVCCAQQFNALRVGCRSIKRTAHPEGHCHSLHCLGMAKQYNSEPGKFSAIARLFLISLHFLDPASVCAPPTVLRVAMPHHLIRLLGLLPCIRLL